MKRWAAGLMLGFGIFFSACLPAINCNPMLNVFITEVKLENQAARVIHVVPVAVMAGSRRRGVAPAYWHRMPAVPALDRRLTLRPGETRRLLYDFDDCNLSELALVDDAGNWRQLVVLPGAEQEKCCRGPRARRYTIRDFETLPEITEAVKRAARTQRLAWPLLVLWLPFTGPFLLVGGVLWRRRLRNGRRPPGCSAPPELAAG